MEKNNVGLRPKSMNSQGAYFKGKLIEIIENKHVFFNCKEYFQTTIILFRLCFNCYITLTNIVDFSNSV